MDLDLLITGGVLVDGTGSPRRAADIGVKDGKVVVIDEPGGIDAAATRAIDASGLVVAPGFVDVHTHLDAQVFWDPWLTPSSLYGTTTVISGNCGFTVAPIVDDESAEYIASMLSRVEGIPIEPLRANVPWSWRSMAEYLDAVDRMRPALNMGFMAGHSTIRRAVLGDEATSRRATASDLERMDAVLSDALAAGAMGFSSSGTVTHVDGDGHPVPSRVADDDELIALSAVTGRFEGTQIALIPCSYTHFDEHHTQLLTEMSRRAQRPLNWNLLVVDEFTDDRLAISDYAAQHGGRVLAISHPGLVPSHYTFLSSVFDPLPNWPEVMTLPPEEKLRALQRPEVRARLRAGLESAAGQARPIGQLERHTIEKGRTPETIALEGRLLVDVAAERGVHPLDLLFDLQVHDELRLGLRRSAIGEGEPPELTRKRESLWTDPRVIVGGSDAGAHLDFLPAYSYTVKFLELTREKDVPLETAIFRLTDMPARLYGLRGRGRVAEGNWADLCIFDAAGVADGPMDYRFDLPGECARIYSQPQGIEHVIVNGVEIARHGELVDAPRPGAVLRSGLDTETVTP